MSILQRMKLRFEKCKVLAHVLTHVRQSYSSNLGVSNFDAQALTHYSIRF